MAPGKVGTTTTVYPSKGEERKDRRDERRQNEDVLKRQASMPSSGLMKHRGSRRKKKSLSAFT